MTDQEYAEMIAIVGMAAERNCLVTASDVAVVPQTLLASADEVIE